MDMRTALSRLSLAERRLLQPKQGFLTATRSSSSSSSSSSGKSTKASTTKRTEAAKEQKTAAVESFVKKYMLMNPGEFPKIKRVQNEVGGSWYLVKDILVELKEKMTGDTQLSHDMANTKANLKVEATSEAAVADDNVATSNFNDPETIVHPLDHHFHQKIVNSVKSHVTVDKACESAAIHKVGKNENLVEHDDTSRRLNSHMSALARHENDQKLECQWSTSTTEQMISNEDPSTESQSGPNINYPKSSDLKAASQQLSFMNKQVISNEEITNASQNGPKLNDTKLSDQKPASKRLSFMIKDMIKTEEDTNVSQNDPDSIDAKSSDGTSVENRDSLSDMTVPTVKELASNRKLPTSLIDFFKTRYADAGADEKKNSSIETLKGERFSSPKMTSVNEFGNKEEIAGLLDRVKELITAPRLHNIFDKSNQHIRDLGNKNGTSATLEYVEFLNPDEQKKTLCEPGFADDIRKPEQKETQGEPLDLSMKNASGRESQSIGHTSSCDGTDWNDNNEEPMKLSFEMFESQIEREDRSGSDSDFAALDYPEESVTQIPPMNGIRPQTFLHTEKGKTWHKLLVKFLQKSATENDIGAAFGDCGPIANINIVASRKDNRFNYGCIYFKTEEGLQKAQTKTDVVIGGADVVVETSSSLRNPVKMTTGPLGFPDVPRALVRNASCTVMIKALPKDLAFHNLRHVLSAFGHIAGFAMGSSSSTVYVEFETEDAKEKALAASPITISGRALSVLRIDVPLTTVVRISNIGSVSGAEIHRICNSHGQVKRVVHRDSKTVDVQFMLTEWPNMVKILNSLNGLVINQQRWRAQPATVIPADILQTLWRMPDEWQHVHSLVQKLCQKIGRDSIISSELADLVAEYHGNKS